MVDRKILTLDELPLQRWKSKGDENWDGLITDNIQMGGDFRMQLFDDDSETKIFPMQADLYMNVNVNKKANLYLKVDVSGRVDSNNEYYIMLSNLDIGWSIFDGGWLKIGKALPNYGINKVLL